MRNDKIQVDKVSRHVIEGKLLESLDDAAHVAIVLSANELELLIQATAYMCSDGARSTEIRRSFAGMARDLRKLHTEAFGE